MNTFARRSAKGHVRVMNELSWRWIALMATAPPLVGVLVAFPIWRTRQTILGNLAGTAVIFAAAMGLILRESVELDRLTQKCLDAGFACWSASVRVDVSHNRKFQKEVHGTSRLFVKLTPVPPPPRLIPAVNIVDNRPPPA